MSWPIPEGPATPVSDTAMLIIIVSSLIPAGMMLFKFFRAAWKLDAKSKRGIRIVAISRKGESE